jgi:branched-chain amino acid transport system substrate-binding protein
MKRSLATLTLTSALVMASSAFAQTMDKNVKIGVLNDQSSLYADITGAGSALAAQMAVEDSGLVAKGWKIEVVAADHQNKPDVGTGIARQWLDVEKVDAIADVPTSSVALAVNNVIKEKNRVFLNSGAAASDLTTTQCSPNTVHWTYDTYLLANGTGKALVKAGGDTWFFLTADYAFGHALERDTAAVVTANGGKVAGVVRHPLNTSDFSSFLLQAQASKAKIVVLPMPAATPPTRSSRRPNSASSRAARNLPGCCCSFPTSTRLAWLRRRA